MQSEFKELKEHTNNKLDQTNQKLDGDLTQAKKDLD